MAAVFQRLRLERPAALQGIDGFGSLTLVQDGLSGGMLVNFISNVSDNRGVAAHRRTVDCNGSNRTLAAQNRCSSCAQGLS